MEKIKLEQICQSLCVINLKIMMKADSNLQSLKANTEIIKFEEALKILQKESPIVIIIIIPAFNNRPTMK